MHAQGVSVCVCVGGGDAAMGKFFSFSGKIYAKVLNNSGKIAHPPAPPPLPTAVQCAFGQRLQANHLFKGD